MRRRWLLAAFLLLAGCSPDRATTIIVGSKNFSEQVVLSELIAQHLENRTGLRVQRRFYLGGTYICHQSMLAGRIDLYPEYTGTALTAILKEAPAPSLPSDLEASSKSAGKGRGARGVYERVRDAYARQFNLSVAEPLGFNNTFAIVVRGEDARRLNLRTISDVARYTPQWRAGFGYEFTERPDGLQGLTQSYGLKFGSPPRIMDLGLLYRALLERQVDLVAGNSTDGLIAAWDLTILEDDRGYFPPYEAVPIVRLETLERHPAIRAALAELAGRISDAEMRQMNYAVDGEHRDVKDVAREFLQ
ncbi:MAG: glycine betaine ABC transporter substrate-binding protein, partial [Candidatus Acidiferrales bacterium]